MYVHGEEAGGQDDAEHGAGDQHRVDGDVDLRVLDEAQRAVFRGIPRRSQIEIYSSLVHRLQHIFNYNG